MTPKSHSARFAYLLGFWLLASGITDCLAADNPLIGTWDWDNARTLRELEIPKDGPESLKKSAATAQRFVEAANEKLGSNVRLTYTEHDCLELIFDSRGNEIIRTTSPYRIIASGPGFVIIEQDNTVGKGKIFLQDNSFYVEVKVDNYTYKDYFTKLS